jgi:tRNA-specific 2-thiouridylase
MVTYMVMKLLCVVSKIKRLYGVCGIRFIKDVLFPLGDLKKEQVRKIAEENDLSTATKKDSTGICFIGEKRFRQFLKNYLPCNKGKIVDLSDNVVGEHEGVIYYTLGQRRGLNIGGMKGGNGDRWFVVGKDVKNNKLIVSQGEGEELFTNGLFTYKVNWIPEKPKNDTFECFAKFRYRQPDQKVKVTILDDKIKVDFDQPQRAVTPGQYVVFYTNTECIGGGVIEEVF